MLFKKRVWCVGEVESAEELAEKLTQYSWTLCTGFRFGGYLFLNDSTSEDGAQEYGIIKENTWKQVESITFGWCNQERALEHINKIITGEYDDQAWESGISKKQIQTPEEHQTCYLCA